ncbi:hypothetical protein [Gemmata sp.]|uniref:hypothetical protein n=1 Tax=Gemmata sp. TaxID=1914242 RepID=UPI003F7091F4
MPIAVVCPGVGCGKKFKVSDEQAGRRAKCPACQTPLTIPAAAAPEAEPHQKPTAAPPPGTPALFTRLKLVVRGKAFTGFKLGGAAKVTHRVYAPDDKKTPLAVVRKEKRPFDLLGMLFGSTKPVRWDVREDEGGDNLVSLVVRRTTASKLSSLAPTQVDADLLDTAGQKVGTFKLRGQVLGNRADLTFVDTDGEPLAAIGAMGSAADLVGLAVSLPDGRRLGTVRSEAMADAVDAVQQGKAKLTVSGFGDPEGHVAEVAPAGAGDPAAHRLLLALAVLVEVTGIGRRNTAPAPMHSPRRGRR